MEGCLHSGYVEKKYSDWRSLYSKKSNSFHYKYLILTESHLSYYSKEPKNKSSIPTKSIPLWEITNVDIDASNLLIFTSERAYAFKVKDEAIWAREIYSAQVNLFLKGHELISKQVSYDFFTENPEHNFVDVGGFFFSFSSPEKSTLSTPL